MPRGTPGRAGTDDRPLACAHFLRAVTAAGGDAGGDGCADEVRARRREVAERGATARRQPSTVERLRHLAEAANYRLREVSGGVGSADQAVVVAAWLTRPRGPLAGQDAARTADRLREAGAQSLRALVQGDARLFVHSGESLSAGTGGDAPGDLLDLALRMQRAGGASVMLLTEDAQGEWTSWEAVDASITSDLDVAGRAYVVDGVAAMGYAAGGLAGFYVVTECGGVVWAREPVARGGDQPEWLLDATKRVKTPPRSTFDMASTYKAMGGTCGDDIDVSAKGAKRLRAPAAQELVALVAPVLSDEAAEAWNKGLHLTDVCSFTRFAIALSRTVGDGASSPADCAKRLRKLMAAAPEHASWRSVQFDAAFTNAHAFRKKATAGRSPAAAAGTAGDGLGASSEARRVVKALLNLARVLRSADAHRDVPSEADSTGPALARQAVRGLLRGANIDDGEDAACIVAEAGYWAHQLRYVLAAHAATAVPAGDIRDAAEAARSKNAKGRRAHLPRRSSAFSVQAPSEDLGKNAGTPLREMFVGVDGRAIFAEGLERLRRLLDAPEKLQGRWARKLPSVFSRDALRLSAEGLHWVLDLLVTKDERWHSGFRFDRFSQEDEDGNSYTALFEKVSRMGEPGSSQGVGLWSDDLLKQMSSCRAGERSQAVVMKLVSMVMSKRAPNAAPGVIGDFDLCHALVLVWPLIAFGGMGPDQGIGSMARRVRARVNAFFKGDWTSWLDVLEADGPTRPRRKDGAPDPGDEATRLVRLGALSRAASTLHKQEVEVCGLPQCDTGLLALRKSFAKRHQVEGGEGEDYRKELRREALELEGQSDSEYGGACAGWPEWAMDWVVHPHLVVYLTKVKDGAAEKVKRFYEECDRLAEEEASMTPAERDAIAERMADEVGGSLRPVMVPTPLLRFMQRVDMQLHRRDVRASFTGWQYCACLPGGTECLGWIARLCWDNRIPFCIGDIPNGFPGCKHSAVLAALKALLPCMVPSFLRWSERGYRAYGPGHKLIDLVVGGHAQGDVLIPIFFGCWMAWVMQQTSKDVRSVQGEGGDLAACAAYADDGAAFGHGCLLWRKNFRANFAKKDNQYVDSGRTLAECIQLFVEVGLMRADFRITCSDWSDDWSDEEKAQARQGGGRHCREA